VAEVLEARFLKVGKELAVSSCQLSVISYQASDICYPVAEVLEARILKVGRELAVGSCQACDIYYPVAEVLEARFSKPNCFF
jgi:hypothetical protein